MDTKKSETSRVKITEFSNFQTVGELKEILALFPDDLNFGFRNQPFQNLFHITYKDDNNEFLCFQEPEQLNCDNKFQIYNKKTQTFVDAKLDEVFIRKLIPTNIQVSYDEKMISKETSDDFKKVIKKQ